MSNNDSLVSRIFRPKEVQVSEIPVHEAEVEDNGRIYLPENPKRVVQCVQTNMPPYFHKRGAL